jgi:predicted O-methyltransferase YrrM
MSGHGMLQVLTQKRELSRFLKVHPVLRRSFLEPAPSNGIDQAELDAIFRNGDFTTGWFSLESARAWIEAFKSERSNILSVLEIGSWEGRSAMFLAWLFPKAKISCIDTFEGGDEHQCNEFRTSEIEARFIANTRHFSERLEILKGSSAERLALLDKGFDLVYIDGSHFYEDVALDSLLAWKRLNPGGILIWDDYFWTMKKVYGKLNPKLAIDQFLTAFQGHYRVLFSKPQVCIRRTKHA